MQGGAEDADDRAGARVEHRSAGRAAAQPERVPAGRADGQFQRVVQEVEAVRGGVRHLRGGQHPCLAPAAGGDVYIGAGVDPLPHGQRQRLHAEALGAHQGEVEPGQSGDRVGADHAGAVAGVQHQPGQAVDGLVAGEQGALVIGEEAESARASGQVPDAYEGGVEAVRCGAHARVVCRGGDKGPVAPTVALPTAGALLVRARSGRPFPVCAVPARAPRLGTLLERPLFAPVPPAPASAPRAPFRHGRTSPPVPVLWFRP